MSNLMMNDLMRRIEEPQGASKIVAEKDLTSNDIELPEGADVIVIEGMDDKKKGEASLISYNKTVAFMIRREKDQDRPTVYEYNYETHEIRKNNQTLPGESKQYITRFVREFQERNSHINAFAGKNKAV